MHKNWNYGNLYLKLKYTTWRSYSRNLNLSHIRFRLSYLVQNFRGYLSTGLNVFSLSCQFCILRVKYSQYQYRYRNISAEYFTVYHSLLHQSRNIMSPRCLNIHTCIQYTYIYMHSVHCTMLRHNDGVMLWLTRLNVFPACTIYTYYTYNTLSWSPYSCMKQIS